MTSEHGPEMQRLLDCLTNSPDRKLVNFNVWWGDKAHELSIEERAKVLNDVFDQEARGEAVYGFKDDAPQIDVIEYLKTL